jgi:hypothetical protein
MHSGCRQRQSQTAPPGQQLNDWVRQAEAANYETLASQPNVDITQSSYRGSLAAN